ncbi:PGPGW domain-containing protein [Brevundimonas variabilis]|uniref:PGPGW domain-containing protein n=1 Tax=Brevundimonas variabilis TaxID=74312 RepID=UPI0031B5F325
MSVPDVRPSRQGPLFVTFVPTFLQPGFRPSGDAVARVLRRAAYMVSGVIVVILGVLIAPLPGPGGIPVIALGLVLILRSSFWAKRQFIRAQYARPRFVYPFRRLLRRKPEIAPVFWQQALRAEKLFLKSAHRRLARVRRSSRRFWRRNFQR